MKKSLLIAIGIQVAIMILVLIPPLLVRTTGTEVYLETEKMDPRALFRGDYVILGYKVGQDILSDEMNREMDEKNLRAVYVTVTTDRPGKFVNVSLTRPELKEGQACIVGRARRWGSAVDFPQIAQYFVPEGEGKIIERMRGEDLLAKVRVTSKCNAVLVGLEER